VETFIASAKSAEAHPPALNVSTIDAAIRRIADTGSADILFAFICELIPPWRDSILRRRIVMLLGIISDSHENMPLIKKAVELLNERNADLVLHAGDLISPISAKEFEKLKCRMVAVFGNNDGEKKMWRERIKNFGEIHDAPFKLVAGGKKILLMHSPDDLKKLAESQKYDVIIYGHTHKPDIHSFGKTLVVNPGELGGWLYGKSTMGLLNIPELKAEIIPL